MNYYYLKVGRGNHLASDWLSGRNPVDRPAVVVFFDNLSQAEYQSGKGVKEAAEFIARSRADQRAETMMVVIHAGEVWVLRPADEVIFLPSQVSDEGYTLTPKVMPVEVVARRSCKDVPAVLAGIGSNQHFARGTFRRIKDSGNLRALDCVVGRIGEGDHWSLAKNGADELLVCLGSTELETLVARLLEAHGCFVAAYRGGMMKDIDLFAHNDGAEPVRLGPLVIPAGKSASVQVKRWAPGMACPAEVDCLVGPGVVGPKTINGEQLLALVKAASPVRTWFQRSLNWLPREFLARFMLATEASAR